MYVLQDNEKLDEERVWWAYIHQHDERIARNEANLEQYEMEKALQERSHTSAKRKAEGDATPRKKRKVNALKQ